MALANPTDIRCIYTVLANPKSTAMV